MLRKLGALGLAVALMAGRLTAAAPASAAEGAPAQSAAVVMGPLQLEARVVSEPTIAEQRIVVEVTATNISDQTLNFWLPSPCHSPFRLTVSDPAGKVYGPLRPVAHPGQATVPCMQVIKPITLAPGQAITERFAWEPGSIRLMAGTYTVIVAFVPHPLSEYPVVRAEFRVPGEIFTDIAGHWASELIEEAVRLRFVEGYPDRSFRPQNQVTRAEFIRMLVTAKGLAGRFTEKPSFADVADHWVYTQGYLEAAVEAAILHPADYEGLRLAPDQDLTRQEAAMMSVRALGHERAALSHDRDAVPFADKAVIAPGAAGYILVANRDDVVRGYEDKTFRPHRNITRAEAVTMVIRTLRAAAVKPEPEASLKVNGTALTAGVLVKERYNRALAPLAVVAEATGIKAVEMENGWLQLTRGEARVRIKPGVPYGWCGAGPGQVCITDPQGLYRFPMDGEMPVLTDGVWYVSETVFNYLGLRATWRWEQKLFDITSS